MFVTATPLTRAKSGLIWTTSSMEGKLSNVPSVDSSKATWVEKGFNTRTKTYVESGKPIPATMIPSREEFWWFLDLQAKHLGGKWQVQGDSWLLHIVSSDPSCVAFQKPDFKYAESLSNPMLNHVPVSYLENMTTALFHNKTTEEIWKAGCWEHTCSAARWKEYRLGSQRPVTPHPHPAIHYFCVWGQLSHSLHASVSHS